MLYPLPTVNEMNFATAATIQDDRGLLYQPHRLQLSGCAKVVEASPEYLVHTEVVGDSFSIPTYNAAITVDHAFVELW